MSDFTDDLIFDLDEVVFDDQEFAVAAVYQSVSGGDPVDVTVVPSYGREPAQGGYGRGVVAEALALVKVSEVPTPAYRDRLTINGRQWRVAEVIEGDGRTWSLALVDDQRPSLRG